MRRLGILVTAAAAGAVALTVVAGLGSAGAAPDPPGNNGTIKVDGEVFDDAPDNEPHVDCVFQVDFYGYDAGDLFADVLFESHPPTGPVQVLLTDTVFIGEDDNSGGGSEAGLDASETYTLDFTGIEPHPNQGFHVKLTIHADGSQGADVKHKVFWVTGARSRRRLRLRHRLRLRLRLRHRHLRRRRPNPPRARPGRKGLEVEVFQRASDWSRRAALAKVNRRLAADR